MHTRKKFTKILHADYSFTSTDTIPPGKRLTTGDVIFRTLYHANWHTHFVADLVATELIEHWTWCNVYTMHACIKQQLQTKSLT